MRYLALASDYDGTLAHDGVVEETTIRDLERLVRSGRKFILVTGRELPDLESVFPRLDLCERVVAENGALLYTPATKERRVLAQRPPSAFLDGLRARGVSNFSVGEVIVATWRPHEVQVLDTIQELGLELQIIFNKDAVMVLPSGVNKSTGLCAALDDLGLSLHNVVGVGDAENDHALLESCECAVAVANALPSLKEKASLVTSGARGEGVSELIARLLENDLADVKSASTDRAFTIGIANGKRIGLPAYGRTVLVCGESGSGKSSFVIGLIERILEEKYHLCLVDPEGDYENLPHCRVLGTDQQPPSLHEIKKAVNDSSTSLVVNLVGVSASDRPHCFASLIATLQEARLRTGRPHWIIIDEAHHVLPSEWAPISAELNDEFTNAVLITVHPEHVSPRALEKVNTVVVMGRNARMPLHEFAQTVGISAPVPETTDLQRGQALIWFIEGGSAFRVGTEPSRTQHDRHRRKYAEGRLEDERIFHFRGPRDEMNLRAQNLSMFVQFAQGLDRDTWEFHLRRGDYSSWMRNALKDSQLADEIERIEKDVELPDQETRKQIITAIERKYTVPA